MIRITDFQGLLSEMVQAVNEQSVPKIEGVVLVVNEKHLVKKLGDRKGIWIAATVPSADPAVVGDDNVAENNIFWMFVMEKTNPGKHDDNEELAQYQNIQDVVTAIKNWFREQKLSGHELLEYLDLNSLHTDPEYQFGGWNGWSLNGNFDTEGY